MFFLFYVVWGELFIKDKEFCLHFLSKRMRQYWLIFFWVSLWCLVKSRHFYNSCWFISLNKLFLYTLHHKRWWSSISFITRVREFSWYFYKAAADWPQISVLEWIIIFRLYVQLQLSQMGSGSSHLLST